MRDLYRLMRTVWPYVGSVLGIVGLAYAFDVRTVEFAQLLRLFSEATERPLFLVLALLAFYFTWVEIRHRNIPLTVTRRDIELRLKTPSGDEAILSREQHVRANHENVTGYLRDVSGDGLVLAEQIECQSDHCTTAKQNIFVLEKTPSRVVFMHRFSEPLPRKLHMLGLNTTKRTETITQLNAYTKPSEHFTVFVPDHYRAKRITISIFFHRDRACRLEDCSAMRVRADGITELRLDRINDDGNGAGIRLNIRKPVPREEYRILWKYPLVMSKAGQ